jgi:hypothetical protein
VSDFFSFCGRIIKLSLRKDAGVDGAQEAVVIFETDSAAKTALLLTNALIVDRPITVVPHVVSAETEAHVEQAQTEITHREFAVPDHERSKTSVVASLLASGYVLGGDAAAQAREFDEKHMISLQLKVGAEQVKAKANEIDKALHISETANVIKTVTLEKAKEVDEKLGLTTKVNQAADAVMAQANVIANKASENEVVAKGVGFFQSIGTQIQQAFQNTKDETLYIVEQKRAQEQGSITPPASPPAVQQDSIALPPPVSDLPPSSTETPQQVS